MPATVKRRRPWFEQGLKRDVIQRTAFVLFLARVLAGLMAWLLYDTLITPDFAVAWPVYALFVVYFITNSVLCLRYRAGDMSPALLRTDLGVNLGTMIIAAGLTGGVLSPVVLIYLIKVAGYLLVYGTQPGALGIIAAIVGFGTLEAGDQVGWWSLRDDIVPSAFVEAAFRVTFLGTIFVGAPLLLRHVANKDRQLANEARRARAAAERERAALTVARTLLAVNDAVCRLTRLDDVLTKVVDLAPHLLGVDYCCLFLWNEEHGVYQGAAVNGVPTAVAGQLTSIRLAASDVPDFEWVRQLGHCAVVAPRGIARLGLPEAPTLLMAPLRSGDRFCGVLQLGHRDGRRSFTQNDIIVADGIAAQAAVALERARLVEESRRLGRAVESTGEAVLITDRHRRVVYANDAFQRMFGYGWEELRGRDSITLGSELSEAQLDEIRRTVVERGWHGESTARRKDGSRFPVALHVSLIRGDDGAFLGGVAIIDDISEQKMLREQVQRSDRLAAAGQIAAGVAHEVNNALVGILGQAQLARHAADSETLRKALACVEAQGERIADIVQELLGFARPRPPERSAVDLRNLVRDTLSLVAHDVKGGGIRSEMCFPPFLPPVQADAKQIQQVLVNLFTNAVHAMRAKGGGKLTVSGEAQQGAVRLHVQDTGTGIAPEALSRVFDPFFSTKPDGNGLGLSVSYAIARAHGGDLTVDSTLGEGTVFTLTLPAVAAAAGAEPRSVLLVDDDPIVAATLREMLVAEGLGVHHAATGRAALAAVAEQSFDAIFLDVRLPDISGPEVYARLAAERPDQAHRVIFVTGGLWRADSRGLREQLPPQPTLSKPCTAAQIREVLRLLRDTRVAA